MFINLVHHNKSNFQILNCKSFIFYRNNTSIHILDTFVKVLNNNNTIY